MAGAALDSTARERNGWLFGFVGILIFSLTLPLTRLAVGTPDEPQLAGMFVALGRAVVAAALSIVFLAATRAPLPARADWLPLAATSAGVVLGFPLLTSLAMREVEAVHASVMVGILPMATAAVGSVLHRQRPSAAFWVCAALGGALVIAYALLRSGGGLGIQGADALLLGAMACAAVGYATGARLALRMPAEAVICWALLLALPLTLPATLASWPSHPVPVPVWWAFAYLGVFPMWLGFFAWYRGLALGGTVSVSQVQLVQPFLSMLCAVPLLNESLDIVTLGFALAVIATVFLSRRMPVATRARIEK